MKGSSARVRTYDNQCEGDHDPSQQLVGYGVISQGVSDGLVVTEETTFKRLVLRSEDEKWKTDWGKRIRSHVVDVTGHLIMS